MVKIIYIICVAAVAVSFRRPSMLWWWLLTVLIPSDDE